MAFHGGERHIEQVGDFGGLESFLVAQDDDHAGRFGQFGEKLFDVALDKRVGGGHPGEWLRHFVEADVTSEFAAAALIDGAAARNSAQPVEAVCGGVELVPMAIEFEEDFLGDLFCGGVVLQEVVGDAEDHRLVFADGGFEAGVGIGGRASDGCMLGQAGSHRCLSGSNTQEVDRANALILSKFGGRVPVGRQGVTHLGGFCVGRGDLERSFEKRSQGSGVFSIKRWHRRRL